MQANCTTPTRRISRTNPITDLLRDRIAARESVNETRLIAAQDAARAPLPTGPAKVSAWPTVSEIVRTYQFARYEFGTLYQEGRCIQAAMTVTNPADPKETYLVQCNLLSGEWSCYCPAGHKDGRATVVIAAVQRRIETNHSTRLAQA